MIRRQIPTAERLRSLVEASVGELTKEARAAWLRHPCTEAVLLLLEASRMQSIERMENGAVGEELTQAMSQSQLASTLFDDIQVYIIEPEEENDDEDTDVN